MIKIISTCILALWAWFGLTSDPTTPPDWSRFTKVTITQGLDEPMKMAFLPNKKIIIVERKGGVKIVDEKTNDVLEAGRIIVNTKYTNKAGKTREAEEGLMGVAVDPNFKTNHWVYLYYADPKSPKHLLSRFELIADTLVMSSEKTVLEVPTQREECCHTGGGMVWDKAGNLFLTTGNNTVNPKQGSSNLVETPGLENEDDQRAAGSTNDLRGKILRIHPEKNGSYSIPKGNLFSEGTAKTKPEIYTMGHRNAWRVSIDSKTNYIYWGEVGPDASKDSTWGPRGYDEFNQAKGPGFFGWPYFIGNNIPYRKYNSADGTYGDKFDVNNPVNASVNNTGLVNLPKPTPAFLWYPYGSSEQFPLMGTSGRSATGGPIFHATDFKNAERPWPSYYENKWLITEFMRGWIMSVTMDENGNYKSMERVLPDMNFSSAIDMEFGPSGDMYVLEYGSAWFKGNENSKLVRLEYNAGNRKPIVVANADVSSGKLPLVVKLSADGSIDNDGDALKYTWKIQNAKKQILATLPGKNATYTFKQGGNYNAILEVSDSKGAKNSSVIAIAAGNEAPELDLALLNPNQTFYFSKDPIGYKVNLKDREDGELGSKIKAEEVAVTFDYLPQGFDPVEVAAKQKSADDMASYAIGRNLIEASDCKSCHQYSTKSIGPSYVDVAGKYPNTNDNFKYLVKKIKEGGSGVWGDHGMSAHPDLSEPNAKRMVDYIMSFSGKTPNVNRLNTTGNITPESPSYEMGAGSFVLRAAYKDKGNGNTKGIFREKLIHLRPQYLRAQEVNFSKNIQLITTPGFSFSPIGDGSYAGFKSLDLTGIKELQASVAVNARNGASGGRVELRIDSPNGELLAVSENVGIKEPPSGFQPNLTPSEIRARNGKAILKLSKLVSGKHDVYLVFRNEKAKPTDILMSFSEVGFFN